MESSDYLSPSNNFFSFSRRRLTIIVIAVAVILAVMWFVYARLVADDEKTVAEQVAEEVAKAENPFRANNPLASVEINPFEKVKKVLNPFGQ